MRNERVCGRMLFAVLMVVVSAEAQEADSPVDRSSELQLISDEFGLADGPAWDGQSALYVPDVKGQVIRRFAPNGNKWSTVVQGDHRYSASFYGFGRLYVSNNGQGKIEYFERSAFGQPATLVADCDEADPAKRRPNDLVIDHSGGIYYTLTGQNKVIYVSPDGQQSVATTEVISPNGITMSPDHKTLYVAAYKPKKIIALDLTSPGKAENAREFAFMDDGEALGADGMTIDRAGNVYCAGATDVWIWNPEGKLLDRIACPTRPINCTFGDSDLRSLYITGFGGLYRQKMKISGRPPEPAQDQAKNDRPTGPPSTTIPDGMPHQLDVVYAQFGHRKVLADIFQPQGNGPFAAVIVVHGGGWLNGDKSKFRALAIELARRGYVAMAIEYRLAGEAAFPGGIHDCNAATRYLRAHAADLKIDPDRIGAVGGSAGGHLVGLMATGWKVKDLQGDGGHADQSSRLQAAIVMAGPMQIASGSVAERSKSDRSKSNSVQWLRGDVDEKASLYHLCDAYEKISAETPPMLFQYGEHDRPESCQPSIDRLKEVGVFADRKVYADGKHGCWNQLPWFNDMVADMDTFFRQHLK
ncbi:MAG: SMP-30/gluconolactonase/LRE family protein [Planctomycetaceae bacterium]|nr:SMP-30/gluconolactonase/LRE family protein [Planctomycetaceae bacterium]